ncbi:MAG: ATP-binding protein [Armatimonadota bacterium]
MEAQQNSSEAVRVGLHEGNILRYVTSLYSDPFDVVREAVQNALDERPSRIDVTLDLRKLETAIRDDGRGMSRQQMRERLKSIGLSSKAGDPDAIGEKGIGLLAPLAIAERATLVSRPRGQQGEWHQLVMRRSDLGGEEVNFPISAHPGLSSEGGWSTLLRVQGISKAAARKLGRVEDLTDHLADAFDDALRRQSAPRLVLRITRQLPSGRWITEETRVEAAEFPGRKDERTIETSSGPVRFRFWLSSEKAKKPVFRVEHQGRTSFPLRDLEQYRDVADVFDSGYVQGSVRVDFCTLRADRHGFEWDEHFDQFLEALRAAAADLRQWLADFQDQQKEQRLVQLLQDVLMDLEEFFRQHPEHVPPAMRALISAGHTGADKNKLDTRAAGRRRAKTATKRDVPPLPARDVTREQKRRRHSAVVGAGGKKQDVAEQSGLTVRYETDFGGKWRSKFRNGSIVLNIGHQDYADAESRGQRSERLYLSQLVWFECSSLAVSHSQTPQLFFRQTFENEYFPLTMSWRTG